MLTAEEDHVVGRADLAANPLAPDFGRHRALRFARHVECGARARRLLQQQLPDGKKAVLDLISALKES